MNWASPKVDQHPSVAVEPVTRPLDRRVSFPTFSASRGVSAPHSYLIEVLSAVGKSLGTGMVTEPVAAHSVPR